MYTPKNNERDLIESLMLLNFKGIVLPLCTNQIPVINRFKNRDFARSLLGFMLYGNGYNLRGKSTYYPDGLFYHDGENIFGIGIFKKTLSSSKYHIMAIAPSGNHVLHVIDSFFLKIHQCLHSLDKGHLLGESYTRHLSAEQYSHCLSLGYQAIDTSPWDKEAASEDEEYNHKLIPLNDIIGTDQHSGDPFIKILSGPESKSFRAKAKMANNRFQNFLNRNQLQLKIVDYKAQYQELAEEIVVRHFKSLKNPVGSTPEDYFNLVRYHAPKGCDQYFGKIGFLMNIEQQTNTSNVQQPLLNQPIPLMLFIGEKTYSDTLALYATFAMRDTSVLPASITPQGFSAISQFCYLTLFKELKNNGLKWVNVGGSETEDLNKFKRQLGAINSPSYWAIKCHT